MVELSALSRLALSYLKKSQRLKLLKDYLANLTKKEWQSLLCDVNEHLSKRISKPANFFWQGITIVIPPTYITSEV